MSKQGRFGTAPKIIVVIGKPNAGKSSLIKTFFKVKTRIGKTPGVTKAIHEYRICENLLVADFPGFGKMITLSRTKIEEIKRQIVQYIERNAKRIVLAILVINTSSFLDTWARSIKKEIIPIDYEFITFINELKIPLFIVLNKIDKLPKNRDKVIEKIHELLKPALIEKNKIFQLSLKTGEGMSLFRREIHIFLEQISCRR